MYRAVRRAALLAAAALIGVLWHPAPSSADEGAPPGLERALTVGTFNIHHGAGVDGVLDLERTAGVIEESDMDVVGLQEVDRHWSSRSDLVDQASWLAERLDMHVAFGANLDLAPAEPDRPRRQYGNAVLSRFPILESSNTLLPRPELGEQRGLLEAVVTVRGIRMRFLSTHLQHDSRQERLAQADAINDAVAQSDLPTVLVGDLNAPPDTPEVERLGAHLDDTWPTAGEGPGFTYPVESPDARIDYVFATASVVAESAEVHTTDASDHLPVVVDVELTAQPGH